MRPDLVHTLKRLAPVAAFALTMGLFAFGFARTLAASPDDAAKANFGANCSACHGEDGGGDTPVGQSLQVPDLRSDEVQKNSDAELTKTITDGMESMPPFKDMLTADQIKGLVGYVRELAKKK